ncbi:MULTISPECIES: hypothetical protein [unclassified Streptomyces]|uniref:hypothetical protein n=1 Tax=unclassified Streptomyces TaxID=2593676 RepID=UPI0008238A60|nr:MULTISPECIES: hypothetical protein [unclassified Streptomyces]SCK14752.1 hypothetical protein YUWDRAFT_00880 [Streptomyces sp. AmelKG-D3]
MPPPRWSTRGHALILHTELYAKLCEALGCFVHHYPERPDPGRFDQHALTRTVATIEQAGYETDPELWTGPARSLVSVAARCNHTPCGPIRPGNCATHGGGDD